MDFSKQVIVVIGGLGGIGQEICRKFGEKGVRSLVIIDILDQGAAKEKLPLPYIHYRQGRVDKKADIKAALEEVVAKFGFIDILINSAGIGRECDEELLININFAGVVWSTLAGIELMRKDKKGRGGSVLNIASVAGYMPVATIPIYCGTKHGVVGFTRSLSDEIMFNTTGIKFYTICPSSTETVLIHNLHDISIFPDIYASGSDVMKNAPLQSPSVVADCIVQALESGENGSVWTCSTGIIETVPMQFPLVPCTPAAK